MNRFEEGLITLKSKKFWIFIFGLFLISALIALIPWKLGVVPKTVPSFFGTCFVVEAALIVVITLFSRISVSRLEKGPMYLGTVSSVANGSSYDDHLTKITPDHSYLIWEDSGITFCHANSSIWKGERNPVVGDRVIFAKPFEFRKRWRTLYVKLED